MFMPLVALLSTAAGQSLAYTLPPPPKPERCTGRCAARYRLPGSSDDDASAKDRALRDDGSKCDVVGAQRCLSARHTILRSDEDPEDTWRAMLGGD
ncbi:hypothetical protein [Sphingomonas sp.]|jgi:hypothetical protein|uniref:hypothetical protein n=1 Tax=Sphingomonas sp. TaxID=28214 RepID=UPI002E363913|nr:hypothetical protein [Sphingomonas sp.]HEX4694956.1 hypothetical protein [Sphingomonas sp.]